MPEDILDPNDPRYLVAKAAQDASETDNPVSAVTGPTGHFPPLVVPPSALNTVTITDDQPPPVLPQPETVDAVVLPDPDPEVSYVAYFSDDPEKIIAIHGRMHRSALVAYQDHYDVLEVPAVQEIALIGEGTWKVQDGEIVPAIVLPDLELVRARAILKIDSDAEQVRLAMITPGSGQALVYQAKKEEALKFIATYETGLDAEQAVAGEWPLIAAELGVTGDSLFVVAQTIKYLSEIWLLKASAIEKVRLYSKDRIKLSTSVNEIREVLTSLIWPEVPE